MSDHIDLAAIAETLQKDLAMNRRPNITDDNEHDVQALCVAEEAGELVGAYRRFSGRARRPGSVADVEHEIADVLIVTAIFAEMLGIDLNKAVRNKLTIIYSRGWESNQ